jgi:flagellar basal-body rod protein FlgB
VPWHTPCSFAVMRTALDNYLGIDPQALTLEAQRTQLLAANLANADTPNYKARDIDFKSALAAAGSAGGVASSGASLALTSPGAPLQPMAAMPSVNGLGSASNSSSSTTPSTTGSATIGTVPDSEVKYRVPLAPSLDGNTVDEQLEESAFAENSVRYQATLTFLNSKLRDLMTAITGQ